VARHSQEQRTRRYFALVGPWVAQRIAFGKKFRTKLEDLVDGKKARRKMSPEELKTRAMDITRMLGGVVKSGAES
jgi:hypothetical protein